MCCSLNLGVSFSTFSRSDFLITSFLSACQQLSLAQLYESVCCHFLILCHAILVPFSPVLLKLRTCHVSIMMLLICKCNAMGLAISRSKELVLNYVLYIICFQFIPLSKLDSILSDYTCLIALLPLLMLIHFLDAFVCSWKLVQFHISNQIQLQ